MADQPTEPGEIIEKRKHSRAGEILFDTLVMILVAAATYAFFRVTLVSPENQEVNNPSVMNKLPASEETRDTD
ncbi:hypothetical protein IK146_01005 [Candidatus Saccharibacteria bacterium]|nr:hypothetical protein [Candidatus Saccharibacteria bacterium]